MKISIATKEQIIQDLKVVLAHNGTPEEVQAFLNEPYIVNAIDSEYKRRKERYDQGECTEEQFYNGCYGALAGCLDLLYE